MLHRYSKASRLEETKAEAQQLEEHGSHVDRTQQPTATAAEDLAGTHGESSGLQSSSDSGNVGTGRESACELCGQKQTRDRTGSSIAVIRKR
jgi:hypothetical protein